MSRCCATSLPLRSIVTQRELQSLTRNLHVRRQQQWRQRQPLSPATQTLTNSFHTANGNKPSIEPSVGDACHHENSKLVDKKPFLIKFEPGPPIVPQLSVDDGDLEKLWHHCFSLIFGTDRVQGIPWTGVSYARDGLLPHQRSRVHRALQELLMTLVYAPREALGRLHGMVNMLDLNFNVRMDCLLYLKRGYWQEIKNDHEALTMFEDVLEPMFDSANWPMGFMKQRHLDLLLEEAVLEQGIEMFQRHKLKYKSPGTSAILRYMDFFSSNGNIGNALNALEWMRAEDITDSLPDVLSRCVNLLKHDKILQAGPTKNFSILPRLLQIGIKPNKVMYSITIRNALREGMSGVGWDLYRFMQEEQMAIDGGTYIVLLRDAHIRGNMKQLDELFTAINQNEDLARNPNLVTFTISILRHLLQTQRIFNSNAPFLIMLPVFARAFSVGPLIRFGVIKPTEAPLQDPHLPDPDPVCLALTLSSYILVHRLQQRHHIRNFWENFKKLLADSDAMATSVAAHDIVFNSFIIFSAKYTVTRKQCVDVVRYMTANQYCRPTKRTWGLVLLACAKHESDDLYRQVRNLMLKHKGRAEVEAWQTIYDRWPASAPAADARRILEKAKSRQEALSTDESPKDDYYFVGEANEKFRLPEVSLVVEMWPERVPIHTAYKDLMRAPQRPLEA